MFNAYFCVCARCHIDCGGDDVDVDVDVDGHGDGGGSDAAVAAADDIAPLNLFLFVSH